jgi:hypothetical protein
VEDDPALLAVDEQVEGDAALGVAAALDDTVPLGTEVGHLADQRHLVRLQPRRCIPELGDQREVWDDAVLRVRVTGCECEADAAG